MARIGDIVGGKYRLEGVLGKGGMGTVYQAEHTLLRKHVAIKLLDPESTTSSKDVERFYREAQAAAGVGHRGIVAVHDVGWTSNGVPYMVMDLLRGETLGQLMSRSGPLGPGIVIELAIQILSALAAVHDKQIIHRDLKPGNIFICRSPDEPDEVKILDFGISKITNDPTGAELTETGALMGTPYYMAPEQARGELEVDHRVDIWALGAILYKAVTARHPFPGENLRQVCFNINTEPLVPPSEIRPGIPPRFEAIMLNALQKEPEKRYQNARQFSRALEAIRDDTFPLASEPSRTPPSGTSAPRRELEPFDVDDNTPTSEFSSPSFTPSGSHESAPGDGFVGDVPKTVVQDGGLADLFAPADSHRPVPTSRLEDTADTFRAAVTSEEQIGAQRLSPIVLVAGVALFLVAAITTGLLFAWWWTGNRSDETHLSASPTSTAVEVETTPPALPEKRPEPPPMPAPEPSTPSPTPPPAAPAAPAIERGGNPDAARPTPSESPLTRDEVEEALQELSDDVTDCLGGRSRRHRTLEISIRVRGDGNAELVSTTPRPPTAARRCLSALISEATFRAVEGEPTEFVHRYEIAARRRPRPPTSRPTKRPHLRDNPFAN